MSAQPIVSVLVTTFRKSPFLVAALDSLKRQTFQDFEIVVIDDASDDLSAELAGNWIAENGASVHVFQRNGRRRGLPANRNLGVAAARGELITFLDGDDLYEPDRLEHHVAYVRAHPEAAVVYGDARMIDDTGSELEGSFIRFHRPEGPPEGLLTVSNLICGRNFIPTPAITVRKSAIQSVGGYDETLFLDDFDMWLKLADRYEVHGLPGSVASYRVLPDSMSRSASYRPKMLASEFAIYRSWYGRASCDAAIESELWSLAESSARARSTEQSQAMFSEIAQLAPTTGNRASAALARLSPDALLLALTLGRIPLKIISRLSRSFR